MCSHYLLSSSSFFPQFLCEVAEGYEENDKCDDDDDDDDENDGFFLKTCVFPASVGVCFVSFPFR